MIHNSILQMIVAGQIKSYGMFFLLLGFLFGIYFLIIWKMKPNLRAKFKRLLMWLGILFCIFFFFDMTTSLITISQINNQLGFSYATPQTVEGEIFEIQRVKKGKAMDKAGLKPWDRVLMRSVNDLYRLLIDNQRKEIVIPILRENEKIEIKIKVPELNVPLAKVSFITI